MLKRDQKKSLPVSALKLLNLSLVSLASESSEAARFSSALSQTDTMKLYFLKKPTVLLNVFPVQRDRGTAHPDLLRQQRPLLALAPGCTSAQSVTNILQITSDAQPQKGPGCATCLVTDGDCLDLWGCSHWGGLGAQQHGEEGKVAFLGSCLTQRRCTYRHQGSSQVSEGTFHPPKRRSGSAEGGSDFWAATQIVPKVLILLSYRGA